MNRMTSFDRFDAAERNYGQWLKLRKTNFVSNSVKLIADMTSALAITPSAATQALASNPNSPIMDLPGVLASVRTNFQEAVEKLAYVLAGTQISATTTSPVTAPTGGIVTSANDSALYNLLVGIYQVLI